MLTGHHVILMGKNVKVFVYILTYFFFFVFSSESFQCVRKTMWNKTSWFFFLHNQKKNISGEQTGSITKVCFNICTHIHKYLNVCRRSVNQFEDLQMKHVTLFFSPITRNVGLITQKKNEQHNWTDEHHDEQEEKEEEERKRLTC